MIWQFNTYRVEWWTEVYETDQYGRRETKGKVFYKSAWPDRASAMADLDRVSTRGLPHMRRVSDKAPHEYHDCDVRRVEVLQKDSQE